MLPMGITNDMLKFMSDNYVPTYGHIGAISGWQTNATGYKKVAKRRKMPSVFSSGATNTRKTVWAA